WTSGNARSRTSARPVQTKAREESTCSSGRASAPEASGYRVLHVPTNNFFAGIRVLDPGQDQIAAAQKSFRLYPYAQHAKPPEQRSRPVGGKPWSQVQPRGIAYWERFNECMQQEPVDPRDRMMTAMLAPLGLEKGKPFKPGDREKKLLID